MVIWADTYFVDNCLDVGVGPDVPDFDHLVGTQGNEMVTLLINS